MNYYKVTQELKKEFIQIQKIDKEFRLLNRGSCENNDLPDDRHCDAVPISNLSTAQINDMFDCFDNLVKVKGNTPKSLKQFSALESSLYDGY
jgi:hypothetical protein